MACYPRVTARGIDSFDYGATKAVQTFIVDRTNGGIIGRDFLQDRPGPVCAAVVYHNNLMRDFVQLQLQMHVFHRCPHAIGLVASGNNDAEQFQYLSLRFGISR